MNLPQRALPTYRNDKIAMSDFGPFWFPYMQELEFAWNSFALLASIVEALGLSETVLSRTGGGRDAVGGRFLSAPINEWILNLKS